MACLLKKLILSISGLAIILVSESFVDCAKSQNNDFLIDFALACEKWLKFT